MRSSLNVEFESKDQISLVCRGPCSCWDSPSFNLWWKLLVVHIFRSHWRKWKRFI